MRHEKPGYWRIRVAGDPGSSLALADLQVTETGYLSLFNGTDLSNWEGAGADAARCWQAAHGLLQCTGQEGPWLRSRAEYGDFRLRLEYRLQEGGNSGVYVRVPSDGNHHGAGAGIEVQMLDDASPRYRDLKPYQFAASLYAVVPAVRGSARAPGQWNSLDIRCVGQPLHRHPQRSGRGRCLATGLPRVDGTFNARISGSAESQRSRMVSASADRAAVTAPSCAALVPPLQRRDQAKQ